MEEANALVSFILGLSSGCITEGDSYEMAETGTNESASMG